MIFFLLPLVEDGDDSASVNADLFPSGLSHVEVLKGRVAPSAVVVGESEVWWAKIGGCYGHRRPFDAPTGVGLVIARDLDALPAGCSVVEQRGAQRCRACPVTRVVQVPIPTSSSCNGQQDGLAGDKISEPWKENLLYYIYLFAY